MMEGLRHHALGVTLLVTVAVVGWWRPLTATRPLGDEAPTVCAALALADGRSPASCERYLYAEVVGRGAATVVTLGGPIALLVLLRASIWLGAAVTLWVSLSLTRWSFVARASLGAVAILCWSPVAQSLSLGNLSTATAGLTVAALAWRRRHATGAGVLLGLAITLKPLPAVVPLVLLAHAAGSSWRCRRLSSPELTSGLVAVVVAAALAAAGGGFAPLPAFDPAAQDSVTLVRALHQLGLAVPALPCFVIVALAAAVLAARGGLKPPLVDALSLVASLLSAPLVWNHSFVFVAPVIALALERAVEAYRRAGADAVARQRGVLALLGVTLAALAITLSDAFAALGHGSAAGSVALGVPMSAPAALFAYLWWTSPREGAAARQS